MKLASKLPLNACTKRIGEMHDLASEVAGLATELLCMAEVSHRAICDAVKSENNAVALLGEKGEDFYFVPQPNRRLVDFAPCDVELRAVVLADKADELQEALYALFVNVRDGVSAIGGAA